MINVAVMGYGTVGSGVVEVLRTNGELINERAQDVINVKYVLDLRDFPGDPVEEILTHDFETIVNDAEVDNGRCRACLYICKTLSGSR